MSRDSRSTITESHLLTLGVYGVTGQRLESRTELPLTVFTSRPAKPARAAGRILRVPLFGASPEYNARQSTRADFVIGFAPVGMPTDSRHASTYFHPCSDTL